MNRTELKRKTIIHLKRFSIFANYFGLSNYYYSHGYGMKESKKKFIFSNIFKYRYQKIADSKGNQFMDMVKKLRISPLDCNEFFYSIDEKKGMDYKNPVLVNHSLDYFLAVKSSFKEIKTQYLNDNKNQFTSNELITINALYSYLKRCKNNQKLNEKYKLCFEEIESLWERPAIHFHEALQRILFINQFMWQTGHNNIGLGHLDWLLGDLFDADIKHGYMSLEQSYEIVESFFSILHFHYGYKSAMILGDTGQYILLGGLKEEGEYYINELTYIFLRVGIKLKLPDPKIILRCSSIMPSDLLELAIDSIATGLGSPLLSNDDMVVKCMLSLGTDVKDAYNYATSACWEPLVPGKSCDQNNIRFLNFAIPLVELLDKEDVSRIKNMSDFKKMYFKYLRKYSDKILTEISKLQFETDVLLSLFSTTALSKSKDIVHGGALYNNLGVTTVGLATVVNSFLFVEKNVWREKKYSLVVLNEIRKQNYNNNEILVEEMKNQYPCYGSDDYTVVSLVTEIIQFLSEVFEEYHTLYGGKIKFGLSSPAYIEASNNVGATFDGRKNREPFNVHISGSGKIALTELISFASQLDYKGVRGNGNVVDYVFTPTIIKENKEKIVSLLFASFKMGLYQIQFNVLDSKVLIDAKSNPDQYKNLIVRVWGFSAYFNDLPDEYKNMLIRRALEKEEIA